MRPVLTLLRILAITLLLLPAYCLSGQVEIWEEMLSLPTYELKAADKNPMFYVPDAYQGAKRVLYPYPLMDNLSTEKSEQEHRAIYLENEYIKLCLLPDIGGRLFYATDKTNNYEIFYRQHVIKPANIGMLGAWISGGIEWCVFHHHRASTHLPVDYRLVENNDGSKTIWFGEIEPRHRMKWSIGLTLHPGKSYIETDVRMFNHSEHTHSILYWANVATHVNDDYQAIFPPSVHQGVYHAKNSFIHWPIADEIYNGKDYTGQIDVSWWKNHPDPISIFAYDLQEDFMGGYDHDRNAGTVHIGNHHIVKGAKLWEWGPGEYGHVWDSEILTDDDGPYAELMVGGFSDNQPDYSWIKPGEVKRLKQYWYPVRDIGGFKKANLDAAVNLELVADNRMRIGINATRELNNCRVIVRDNEKKVIFEKQIDIGPATPFTSVITLNGKADLTRFKLSLLDQNNMELISYQEQKPNYETELPDPVTPPAKPDDIKNMEELVLTGQRIMQFHNPGLDPRDYFMEAISRDPLNSMANLHLGNLASLAGKYDEAADYYRNTIHRLTNDYTRPRDCEALYRLGVVLKKQKKYDAAIDTLYRATWDQAWFAAAYFELAGISMLKGHFDEALDQLNHSLAMNAINPKAYALKSAILRHLGERANAGISARRARILDPLDHMASFELLLNKAIPPSEFISILNDNKENYLELASGYANSGLYEEATEVIAMALYSKDTVLSSYPILYYLGGWIAEQQGDKELAERYFTLGSEASTDYAFPFRFETLDMLQAAIEYNPNDASAWYYMGNILYDHQPGKAIMCWKQAVSLNHEMAIAHRNLGWGYYRYLDDIEGAIAYYEAAIGLKADDPRYYFELDVLYEMNNESLELRYDLLSSNPEVVKEREDSYLRMIEVLILNREVDSALSSLAEHTFLRQEGIVHLHDLFVDAHLLKGWEFLQSGAYELALEHLLLADTYPPNMRIGRISNYQKEAQIYYFTGLAYQGLDQKSEAKGYFRKALDTPAGNSEYIFYRALSQHELKQEDEASISSEQLIKSGKEALQMAGDADFFAKFGERAGVNERKATAYYHMALGYEASGESEKAQEAFAMALKKHNSILWANVYSKQ
jgi:tetratricopeptide (TPR) repeat protein